MVIIKKKYFLIIESIKDIDLKNIKIRNKFFIIYRNHKKKEKLGDLLRFRRICKLKAIKLYIANNFKLAISLNADGVYLSSYNKDLRALSFKKFKFELIGSAHNFKEILYKTKQGCNTILLSRLFLVNYDNVNTYLGVVKFNNYTKISKKLIPLGGIKNNNLNELKNVNSQGFALLSEIKKKPAKIFSRLF